MSATLAIAGATAIVAEREVADSVVVLEDGLLRAVGGRSEVAVSSGAKVVDAGGLLLAPGLIELQVNGGFGHDFTAHPASIWAVGERLVEHGVTAFLPTIISSPPDVVEQAQAVIAAGPPAGYRGAVALGLHLEGPFLDPEHAGAHDPAMLRAPGTIAVADWTPTNGVRMVTLAPELEGGLTLVGQLAGRGVVVSAGHSGASCEQGEAAIAAGVRYATHLFNAMPQLDHRAPGLAAALLADERVTIGLIPDGVHVHPALLRLVDRLAGVERLSIVTDAAAPLGMPDGAYVLGGAQVELADGAIRRADGRLAGSALTPDECLRRLARFTGRPAAAAVAAMTSVPARLLGIERERGTLASGARADLVLLTPALEVVATYVDGEEVFARWR